MSAVGEQELLMLILHALDKFAPEKSRKKISIFFFAIKRKLYILYAEKRLKEFLIALSSLELVCVGNLLLMKADSGCAAIKFSRTVNWQSTRGATQFSSFPLPPSLPPRPSPLRSREHTHTCCDSGMITDDLSVTGCRYRGWIIVLIAKYEIIRERDRRPSIIGQRWPLVRRRSFIILAQPSPSSYSHRIADVPLFVYRT